MRKANLFLISILIIFSFKVSAQFDIMVSTDYPPYNYIDDKGKLVGFNIDILNAIKKLYNVEIKVVGEGWKIANTELEKGNIQAIAGVHYPGNPDPEFIYTRSFCNSNITLFFL